MLSHAYSLLKYIAATSRFFVVDDMREAIGGTVGRYDYATLHSVGCAFGGLTEEKRLIPVSTVSVLSWLAVELEKDEVCSRIVAFILVPASSFR